MAQEMPLTGVVPPGFGSSPPALAGAGGLASASAPPAPSGQLSPNTGLESLPSGFLNQLMALRLGQLGGQSGIVQSTPSQPATALPPAPAAVQTPLPGASAAPGGGAPAPTNDLAAQPSFPAAVPSQAPSTPPGAGAAMLNVTGPSTPGAPAPINFMPPPPPATPAPQATPTAAPPTPAYSNELGLSSMLGGTPLTQQMINATPAGTDPLNYWAGSFNTPSGGA